MGGKMLTLAFAALLLEGVQPWSVPASCLAGRLRAAGAPRMLRGRACGLRVPGLGGRAVAQQQGRGLPLSMTGALHSQAESSGRQDPGAALMARLGAIADANERRALLRDNFQACDDPAMQFLASKLQAGAEGHWEALLTDLQALMTERLEAGKGLLTDLLASGEINVLDRKIVEKVKSGECDPSFLNVLQINLQDAEQTQDQEDGSQRLQVLMHIYTRVQEELEKKAKPAMGLLHKLLRMIDEPEIRMNVLEHNLKPKPEEERAMIVVDGKMTTDAGARVRPMDLSWSIVEYMNRIRGLDQMDAGFSQDDIAQTFEDCRVIAKQARVQVERFYSPDELQAFTESLTPVFEPIMGTLANYRRGP